MMHINLLEYSDTYSKTSGISWQYYRDEPGLNNSGFIIDFPVDNNIVLRSNLNSKWQDKEETLARKMLIMVPLNI